MLDPVPLAPPGVHSPHDTDLSALKRAVASFVSLLALTVALAALATFPYLFERAGLAYFVPAMAAVLGLALYPLIQRWPWIWNWLGPLATVFPPLQILQAHHQHGLAVEKTAEVIERVIADYHLGAARLADDPRRRWVESIPFTVPPEEWTERLARWLAARSDRLDADVLTLLALDWQRRETARAWQRLYAEHGRLERLAAVLIQSGRLPLDERGFPCEARELVMLLRDMPAFTMNDLRQRLDALNLLALEAAEFLTFLQGNEILPLQPPATLPSLSEVLSLLGGALDAPRRRARLLTGIARREIGAFVERRNAVACAPLAPALADDASDAMLDRYARVAAVMFLGRRFSGDDALAWLCRELAKDEYAVEMTWAFLDLKQDLRSQQRFGDQTFVTLVHLIEVWRGKVEEARAGAEADKEMQELANTLATGEWISKLSVLIERAQTRRLIQFVPGATAAEAPREVARRAVANLGLGHRRDLLSGLFRTLDLEAISRNLETGRFTPYLLTFSAQHGPLSRLIDCLGSPAKLRAAGVGEAEVAGRPKYNFRQYTENTRIGLVPEGWTFEAFRREFQDDFTKVLAARAALVPGAAKVMGIEVMLHRFGSVGRYHHPFESEFSSHLALARLKELLADSLDSEELLTIVQYAGTLDTRAALLGAPIADLAGPAVPLSGGERRRLEAADGPIKGELLAALREPDLPRLGRDLRAGQVDHRRAAESLAGSLAQHVPHLDGLRAAGLAEAYLHGLESIAA